MGQHHLPQRHWGILVALCAVLGIATAVVWADHDNAPRGAADTVPALSSPAGRQALTPATPANVQPQRPAHSNAAPHPTRQHTAGTQLLPVKTPLARGPLLSSDRSAVALSSAGHRAASKVASHAAKARRGGSIAAHVHQHRMQHRGHRHHHGSKHHHHRCHNWHSGESPHGALR
jgi:hypothetical protein